MLFYPLVLFLLLQEENFLRAEKLPLKKEKLMVLGHCSPTSF